MIRVSYGRQIPVIVAAFAALSFVGLGSAHAFVSNTPTLPLLDSPYTVPGGNCFPTAGLCISGGTFTLTSVVSFNQTATDELITANATDLLQLTNLSSQVVGSVSLTGTITQDVIGRLNPDDTGSWTVDLTNISLSGTLQGGPVTLALNPADTSSGITSIAQDGAEFDIDSYFDVFATVSYTPLGGGPLTANPSGTATATAAPEPARLALLAGPVLAMVAGRRRLPRLLLVRCA